MGKKYKKIWTSKAERDAWEAKVDQDLRRLQELAEKGWAELEEKKRAAEEGQAAT
jgi:hypothetical protein